MNILEVKENKEAVIKNIKRKDNPFIRKIEAMGIKKGEKIKVLSKVGRNIVVQVEGRKLAIDEELAKEIEVE